MNRIEKFLEEVKAARKIVEAGEKAKTLSLIERRKSERQAAKEAEKQRCLAIARKLAEEKAARDAAEASACPGKGFIIGDNGQWIYDPKAERGWVLTPRSGTYSSTGLPWLKTLLPRIRCLITWSLGNPGLRMRSSLPSACTTRQ